MNRIPVEHPGLMLMEDFLNPLGITQYALAKAAGVPRSRINAIVQGQRGISPETSIRIGRALGMSDFFFLNLQQLYDKAIAEDQLSVAINDVTPIMKKA